MTAASRADERQAMAGSRAKLIKGEDFALRQGKPSDHNLVLQSWIRSHRRNCFRDRLDDISYAKGQEWLVKQLLDRCALYVACSVGDEDFVMAWAVTSDRAVHYCWTRHAFRRHGLAATLLAPYIGQPTTYTHPISVGADWMKGKWDVPKGWIFDPFHAFRIAAFPKPRDDQ